MCYLNGFFFHGSSFIPVVAAVAFLLLVMRTKKRPRLLKVVFVVGLCVIGARWVSEKVERQHREDSAYFGTRFIDEKREMIDAHARDIHARARKIAERHRSAAGVASDDAASPSATSIDFKLRTDAIDDLEISPEQLAQALWTSMDLCAQAESPEAVDLRSLEQIEVGTHDAQPVLLKQVARLSRRTESRRGKPRDERGVLTLNVRVDDEDADLNVEEIALELESREIEKPQSERAMTSVDAGAHALTALIMISRMPKQAQAPEAVSDAESPADATAPGDAAGADPQVAEAAPAIEPGAAPSRPLDEVIEQRSEAIATAVENVAEALGAAAERAAERAADSAERVAEIATASGGVGPSEVPQAPAAPAVPLVPVAPEAPEIQTAPDIQAASAARPAKSRDARQLLQIREERPAWVDQPRSTVGDVYSMSEMDGPFATRRDCELALPDLFQRMVRDYSRMYLGEEVELDLEALYRSGICREAYFAPKDTSVGPMLEVHALAVFDRRGRELLSDARRARLIRQRLEGTAGVVALVMGLMGTLFGYLKLDTATRGYYAGRLKLAAGAMAFAVVGLVTWLMQW